MQEYQFRCQKCGQIWFATDKDIRQSKKMANDLAHAKVMRNLDNVGGLRRGKKYIRQSEQVAQMQVAQFDPERCPNCGSRQVWVFEEPAATYSDYPPTVKSGGNKFFVSLAVLFMPYLAFFLVLIKKPFSRTVNRRVLIYCAIMSCIAFAIIAHQFNNKDNNSNKSQINKNIVVSDTNKNEKSEATSNTSEESSPVIKGFYKTQIEEMIEKMYNEGLKFSTLNYLQSDYMGCGFWTCTNTFKGKMTKKDHVYTVRIGHNELHNDGRAEIFYLAIDAETIFWDEDAEDEFFRVVGR